MSGSTLTCSKCGVEYLAGTLEWEDNYHLCYDCKKIGDKRLRNYIAKRLLKDKEVQDVE